MTDHSPSTDERASLAQPSQSSSPLECTSHLGFSLDALFNNYGLQFRKLGGDGAELAKRMTKEEIGPELEKLIKNIAG